MRLNTANSYTDVRDINLRLYIFYDQLEKVAEKYKYETTII